MYINPVSLMAPSKRIACIGTMQLNRKGIPDGLKENKNRELLSSEICWDENSPLSILPCVVKTSKGKNTVISSSILGITKDDGKKKLGIYKVYDFTKVGANIIDQRINHIINPSKQDFFEYCYILLYQFVKPFLQSRSFNGYYSCETKDRVSNRKKAMGSGR